ncbi:pyridoxamine 5'-phosphate oxidase family protein [Paenibacillus sp. 481]|uniref:pyridoxamine 5'-phosphate oxidase family protein n=1 Tax=Paenibacillus sp. 481 TaxID=2835869 RepID=UPI001E640E6F|nr:pyridoxamine 5'-phosphate oxidase family protein [Paenibacillus sp. 481]UHA74533.1 pyridoxamine 5'-phosphate oxidase family protein [Paenibacillus sp. 481]
MRRSEFAIDIDNDPQEIAAFLHEQFFGYLATTGEDGFPRIKPLNFVYDEQQHVIYFHSSRKGEKMSQLAADPRASFAVAEMHSLIPSYFTNPVNACPATNFFRSVYMKGTVHVVTDLQEKAAAFTAFMEKLQPEGGYEPFDWTQPGYKQQEAAVSLMKLQIEHLSAKFKFGQNLTPQKVEQVEHGLAHRQAPGDEATIEWMRKLCPHRSALDGQVTATDNETS